MVKDQLQIRKAVRPDIDVLLRLDHAIKTTRVWQMQQNEENGELHTRFIETQLPREMRIPYPHSPEGLEAKWSAFPLVLVGCMDQVPIGFITLDSCLSPDMVWIRDLVVDGIWRRQGVASRLLETTVAWAKERSIFRLLLEMSSKNFPAISFAKKSGFDFSGFNDNYFSNRDIALFFTRDLRIRLRG